MNATNSNLFCAIRGPLTLITVGTLFAIDHMTPYGFHQTWPVLLIVFGVLSLLCRAQGSRNAVGGPGGSQ